MTAPPDAFTADPQLDLAVTPRFVQTPAPLPEAHRPLARFASVGPDGLSTAELLNCILRAVDRDPGAEIVRRWPTLDLLIRATADELRAIPGMGPANVAALRCALSLPRRVNREHYASESPVLDHPEIIAEMLHEENRPYTTERFQVVLLNTRRRLIRTVVVADGTLDTLLVHPREVFKTAIAANAAALILVHNHPSGDPSPSEADIKVTRDLIRAGQLLKIEVMDHVILGRSAPQRSRAYSSLRELGYFYA